MAAQLQYPWRPLSSCPWWLWLLLTTELLIRSGFPSSQPPQLPSPCLDPATTVEETAASGGSSLPPGEAPFSSSRHLLPLSLSPATATLQLPPPPSSFSATAAPSPALVPAPRRPALAARWRPPLSLADGRTYAPAHQHKPCPPPAAPMPPHRRRPPLFPRRTTAPAPPPAPAHRHQPEPLLPVTSDGVALLPFVVRP